MTGGEREIKPPQLKPMNKLTAEKTHIEIYMSERDMIDRINYRRIKFQENNRERKK